MPDKLPMAATSRYPYAGGSAIGSQLPGTPLWLLSGPGILAILWFAYVVGNVFYVFPAGNPQPADFVMAVLIGAVLIGPFIRVPMHWNVYFYGYLALTWFWIVNTTYFSMYTEKHFFLASLYYAYNFGIVVAIITLFSSLQERFLQLTRAGLLITVVAQLFAVVVLDLTNEWGRSIGTLDNANQFGYWAALTAACWLVLKADKKLGMLDLLILGALSYITIRSLSKAAVATQFVLIVGAVFLQGIKLRKSSLIIIMMGLLFGLSTGYFHLKEMEYEIVNEGPVAHMIERFERAKNEEDSSLSGRGYDRIWKFPEYLVFGAGEGAYHRFFTGSYHRSLELHSTWGTLLFCYGIVGVILFALLLINLLWRAPVRYLFYVSAILIYGLSHQAVRFSLFWVLLGLIFCMTRYSSASAAVASAPSPSNESRSA